MDGHTFKLQGRAVRLSTCEPDEREPHRVPVRISPCDTVQHYSYLLGPLLNSLAENVLFKHKSPIAQAHGRDNPSPDVLGLWVVKKSTVTEGAPLGQSLEGLFHFVIRAENTRLVLHASHAKAFFFFGDRGGGG